MNGLIELIFEAVPDLTLNQLINALINGAVVTEITHSELGRCEPDEIRGDYLKLFVSGDEATTIFLKTARVTIGSVSIDRPLISILRFQNLNDVTVVFSGTDIEEIDRQDAIFKMSKGAKILADQTNVTEFYCGFEPATDTQTRMFTGETIGPLTDM